MDNDISQTQKDKYHIYFYIYIYKFILYIFVLTSFIDMLLKYTKYSLMNDDVLVYLSTVRFVQSS